MAEKPREPYSLTAPREFIPNIGRQDAVEWATGAHPTGATIFPSTLLKSAIMVGAVMNDDFTVAAASPNFATITNGSVFFRPDFECHVFFDSHWIFQIQSGSPAATAGFTFEIQTWLNQYHILISPSGFANDWSVTIPAGMAASQTWEFNQTFQGAIFNLEFRRSPDAHIIDFLYRVQTIPAGWGPIAAKPRITYVYAVPSNQISFVNNL